MHVNNICTYCVEKEGLSVCMCVCVCLSVCVYVSALCMHVNISQTKIMYQIYHRLVGRSVCLSVCLSVCVYVSALCIRYTIGLLRSKTFPLL